MIVLGSVLLIIGGFLIISFILNKTKCRTKVEATVSKIEVKKTPLRGTTLKQYTPVFTYMLNSNKHTVKADILTSKKEMFSVGQKLTVFVDPNNPETVHYGHNWRFLFSGIAFALFGGLIFILTLT